MTKEERKTLRFAAALLRDEAKCLRESCTTLQGRWPEASHKDAYDMLMQYASRLERIAAEPGPDDNVLHIATKRGKS
jgi:hypothetical protein